MVVTIWFGLWWWLVGVPEDKRPEETPAEQ